jgi:hypothetical protein
MKARIYTISIGWLIASLLALSILLCGAYLMYLPLRARYLFNGLETVQLSNSSFEDAQRLAQKIGAKPSDLRPCDQSYCLWSAKVDNARLPQWWRGSGVTFTVDFEVRDSSVVYKGAWYAIGVDPHKLTPSIVSAGADPYRLSPPYVVSAGVKEKWIQQRPGDRIVEEPPTAKGWEISYFEKNGARELATARFVVRMTPRSSAEDWTRYTAFNYSCLWKYRSCRDGTELLPTSDPPPSELMNGVGPRQ